ncbi:hypothetical protein AB1K84_06480 [Mesobacillus foraminis]|uniref:hypothetical protein n=1 Tax=Mesobacillus foraminis TaxID=279826 RepID=UPI0039A30F89
MEMGKILKLKAEKQSSPYWEKSQTNFPPPTFQTMTVRVGKTIPDLRNEGSHGIATNFFLWIIQSQNSGTDFLHMLQKELFPLLLE